MKGFLNQEQIEYVLFHPGYHIDLSESVRKSFVFIHEGERTEMMPGKMPI